MIEEAWKKAEEKLARAHVPVDVRIKVGTGYLGEDDNPFGQYVTFLGYMKVRNQWRVCFVREITVHAGSGPEEEFECKPITEWPVETRLEMFDWFPVLHAEVVKVTRAFAPKIRDKVAEFETTLASI